MPNIVVRERTRKNRKKVKGERTRIKKKGKNSHVTIRK